MAVLYIINDFLETLVAEDCSYSDSDCSLTPGWMCIEKTFSRPPFFNSNRTEFLTKTQKTKRAYTRAKLTIKSVGQWTECVQSWL